MPSRKAPDQHHLPLARLQAGIDAIKLAPADGGRIELIVRRPAVGERELLTEARLDEEVGPVGDCWRTRGSSSTPDGAAHPDHQVTLMNARAIELIAGERERWALAGDQFYVDLDLSEANLPAGTNLQVGSALLTVTADPHLGCGKFLRRYGVDAIKFVNSKVGRELHLRGVNARVLRGGAARVGDLVCKAAA